MTLSKPILDIEAQIMTDPYNPLHHIALAKTYISEGEEGSARKVVATKRILPSRDPSIHFEWGKLCELLGMAQQAREEYEKAIALDSTNPESHFRLALLFQEKGLLERTLKHLQKTVSLSPHHREAKKLLSSLYEEMGLLGSARMVQGREKPKATLPRTVPFVLTEKDTSLLLSLFQGREVGYALYQIDNTGNTNHCYVNKVLSIHEISRHITGEKTIGVYPLRSDGTLKYTGIQIRIPWRKVVENIKNAGLLAILKDKVHSYARQITERVLEWGIPVYGEDSGDSERRIWFFFEEFIPFDFVERFLNTILNNIQAPAVDISINLLLGFKGIGIGWEDYPVMLPLGVNLRTGKRCFFHDDEGTPYEDQLTFIKKIRRITRNEIRSFVKRMERGQRQILDSPYELLKRIEKSCPVIDEIIRKARSGRNLRQEEKKVLYFTLGFLGDGLKSLHAALEPCPDYRPHKVARLAPRLASHPISCPKIRELLPEVTAYLKCNCAFDIPEGGYPSPLLHVDPKLIPLREGELSPASSVQEVARYYLSLVQKLYQLNREKDEVELKLRHLLDKRGIGEIKVSSFTVKKVMGETGLSIEGGN